MIDEADRQTISRLLEADGDSFVELARIAGLDPASSFRGADLRNVDFSGCDLAGYDFSGSDLRGASFLNASIKRTLLDGANVAGVWWPTATKDHKQKDRRSRALNAFQQEAVNAMTNRLENSNRAVALMPTGTGVHTVMVEIVAWTGVNNNAWSLVIVRGAAERNQMISRLRERFPETTVVPLAEAARSKLPGGIAVHAASAYDAIGRKMFEFVTQLERVALIVTNTIDRITDLLANAEGVAGMAPLAAVIPPLIDADRPDRRRQYDRVTALFGDPAYVLELRDVLAEGALIPVHIHIPFPFLRPMGARSVAGDQSQLGELVERFASLIVQQSRWTHQTLVLCRNNDQAQFVAGLLKQLWQRGPEVRFAEKWRSADELTMRVEHDGGILVAGLSRVAIAAAVRSDSVVVLAPLDVSTAQELAFRPRSILRKREPKVLDLAQAFRGFPDVQYGSSE